VVLVDTTVWIGLLRGAAGPAVERLRVILEEGDAAVAPVIVQEIVQGARDEAAFKTLQRRFSALPMIDGTSALQTHLAAGRIYARCRWAGITPRSPHDCLIAQIAIEHGVPLLHDDRDFELLAQVEPRLALIRG
jgi:predicted nucleic acid-binding protein